MFVEEKSIILLLCLCLVSGFVNPSCRYFFNSQDECRILSLKKHNELKLNIFVEDNNFHEDRGEQVSCNKKGTPTLSTREARITGPFAAMMTTLFVASKATEASTESLKSDQAIVENFSGEKSSVENPQIAKGPAFPAFKSTLPTTPASDSSTAYTPLLQVSTQVAKESLSPPVTMPELSLTAPVAIANSLDSTIQKNLLSFNNLLPAGLGLGTLAAVALSLVKKREVERMLWRENAFLHRANKYAEARMDVQKAAYKAKMAAPKNKAASRTSDHASLGSQQLLNSSADLIGAQELIFSDSTNHEIVAAKGYLDALGKSSPILQNTDSSNSVTSSEKSTSRVLVSYLNDL
jgi:hypothetical protein